jgi:hypothetical protein|tara:strand:- start:399 stop:842 length:444 start_codon:yes stop_codon:yes gene_type:complete
MKKIVKLTENDISNIVKKVLKERVDNPEMSGSWERSKYEPTDREKDVKGVFGKYGEDMLPNIIRYLRKNPDAILRRMSKMYPEIYMRHIPFNYSSSEGPMDESEEQTIKQTKYNKSEVDDAANNGIGIEADGTVTPDKDGGLTITSK